MGGSVEIMVSRIDGPHGLMDRLIHLYTDRAHPRIYLNGLRQLMLCAIFKQIILELL